MLTEIKHSFQIQTWFIDHVIPIQSSEKNKQKIKQVWACCFMQKLCEWNVQKQQLHKQRIEVLICIAYSHWLTQQKQNKIFFAARVYIIWFLFLLQWIKLWNLNDSFMLHMLCKLMPTAYVSTQNSNFLKFVGFARQKPYTNTVHVYSGKHQHILQVLNTSSGVSLDKLLISCKSYNTM